MSVPGRAPTPPSGGPDARATEPSGHARASRPFNGTLEMDASQALAAGLLTGPTQAPSPTAPPAPAPPNATASPEPGSAAGLPSGAKAPDPLVGTTLDGRYVVDKRLGEGGMGVVYLARHRVIGRKVALKILRAEFARDQEIVERFLQEAKTASSIGNPHIIDIHDFGVLDDGSTYFAMEFLDGEPLMDVIVRDTIPLERILAVGIQICDGLGAAHQRGIVHRDLKPDNVYLLRRGEVDFVKVLDFGIAKVEHAAGPKLTRAGAVFGTPHYMSPEQAAGTAIDHRADIYALGVILYEMATGQLPFDSDNAMTILSQHMYKAPVPLRSLLRGADRPAGLEAIVQKCLLKRPEHRYASMADLAEDLKKLQRGEAPSAISDLMARSASTGIPADYFRAAGSTTGPIVPASPSGAGSRKLVIGLGAVAVLGVGLAVAAFALQRPASSEAASAPASASPPEAVAPATTTRTELRSSAPGAVAVYEGREHPLPYAIVHRLGQHPEVEIRAPGFAPKTVKLEADDAGGSRQLDVELEASPEPAKVAGSSSAPTPTPVASSATTAVAAPIASSAARPVVAPPPATTVASSKPASAPTQAPRPAVSVKPKDPPREGPISIF